MTVAGFRSWLFTIVREFGKIPHYNSEGERLLRAMRNGNRLPRRDAGRVRVIGHMPDRDRRKRSVALGAWPLAVLSLVFLVAADVDAAVPLGAVRALAEDVLGAGSVISVHTSDDGAQVLMRWESPTYKPSTRGAATREMIFAEAQLATGSVMGQLNQINRIRFTIVKKNQMLATGENSRGHGVIVMFSLQMGGGIMRPTNPVYDPTRQRGGQAASEL